MNRFASLDMKKKTVARGEDKHKDGNILKVISILESSRSTGDIL